jgi:hypothetical protein
VRGVQKKEKEKTPPTSSRRVFERNKLVESNENDFKMVLKHLLGIELPCERRSTKQKSKRSLLSLFFGNRETCG